MKMDDMILVSVDDHVCEPADMFKNHIPAKYKDTAPHVVNEGDQLYWVVEDERIPDLGLNAVVGRPKAEYGFEPQNYDQMRKGTYDVHARIDDMNVNGLLGSLCFPTYPHFAGTRFMHQKDKNLGLATMKAYNDWFILEWCGAYPDRFIPMCMLPFWDMNLALEEFQRCIKMGVHAVNFMDNPARHEFPSLHDDYWDPFWKMCADNEVVINCHIGTGASAAHSSDQSPIAAWIAAMPISIATSASDWLFASFWDKYPKLRMALSEGGIGWVPYMMERADYVYDHHGAWTNLNNKLRPSEVLRKHIITCFIADDFGLQNIDAIGVDNITYECDYPHSDTQWPTAPEHLWNGLKHLDADVINKITWENACRDYKFDPFKTRPKEKCTVAALREEGKGVDISEQAHLGGKNPMYDPSRPVTTADIMRIMGG